MNDKQYRKALEQLGLTQTGAAKMLKINDRTSRRWARGEGDGEMVPNEVALLLNMMVNHDLDELDLAYEPVPGIVGLLLNTMAKHKIAAKDVIKI